MPHLDTSLTTQRTRLLAAAAAAAFLALAGCTLAAPRPEGEAGEEAEALAREMQAAIDHAAWERTGAVRFSFRGSRDHLWDRRRQLARVRWKDVEVLVDLDTREGVARRDGREVSGEKAARLVSKAYAAWVNDSFWLNPISKIFDEGTERRRVALEDGGRGLLVEYTRGGLTPGDAYLWEVGDDGLPTGWRMWTSNLPKGGMRASWEDWQELSTGVRVATSHKVAIGTLEMHDVAGAATLAELEPGPDPFADLLARTIHRPEQAEAERETGSGAIDPQ